jgi:formate dehydrogenase alpha subunit
LSGRAPAYVKAIGDAVGAFSWPAIEAATGAKAGAVADAARTLAQAPRAVVVVGQGVLRAPGGSGLTTTLLDLLLLTGHHGRPGCGVAPLAEENNDQGAVEMGTVAEYLPGPAELNDARARERLAGLWKEELSKTPGRTLMEILDEAGRGSIKAMVVVGENPVGSLPQASKAKEALERLEFLVVQELFLTETAALADVVLPACSYAEKNGTFTNTEGHVQAVRQAIEPIGESRPDWEIFSALSGLMGYPIEYGDAKEILKEIRSAIPGYGLLGPAPTAPRPDTAAVDRYLREGYATDLAARYALAGAGDTPEQGLMLWLTQSLFHSGKLSTRAKGLLQIQAAGSLALNPRDAERLGVAEGESARVSNSSGEMTTAVRTLDRVPEGLAWFPEHFDGDARRLLRVVTDPETGVPYYKSTRVTVQRL